MRIAMAAIGAKFVPTLVTVLLLVGAGFLTGCNVSLNQSDSATGDLQAATRSSAAASTQPEAASTRAMQPTARSAATPGSAAYKIGALDVLDISVFKVPELSKHAQVADSGTVNLPLVGEIPVAGKTAQQVERELAAKLGDKYLKNPQVTVLVKEYNSQRITVEGAIKKPGIYPMRGKTSLLQTIAMADGLDPNSDSTVVVFRYTPEGQRSAAKFDIGNIRSGQADDPTLQGGDVVVVGSSAIKEGFNNVIKMLPLAGWFALL
jgi:polysaccharide export outer membrane protein